MAKPTTMKELQAISEAMLCHTKCGKDKACHKSACSNPFAEKQARCEKLEEIVACYHGGGSHATCPHLDNKTNEELMQEPWSLAKDIANHVADYLLPLPEGQEVSADDVRACHMRCGHDHQCHKNCPTGVYGRLKDQCDTLDNASSCHHACEQAQTKCPFKKTECHFQCPMSMPTSVNELKGLTDHVLCHTTCGQDKACHGACPNSNWDEKKTQCKQYKMMMTCHMRCGSSHSCHASCPHLYGDVLNGAKHEPSDLLKEIADVLIV
jgi:hypothetical protein